MIEYQRFGRKSINFICRPLYDDARINILEGSVRSSKTVTMIPKWLHYCKNGPPGLCLMSGVSKDTLYDNVLRDVFDTVGAANYSYNRQSGDLILYKREIKVIGAKDEGSEKYLRGKTLAGAYADEASLMPERFFKQLLNRMSVKGAKLYLTTNPDSPSHYLYKDYISNQQRIDDGMVDVVHFTLDDNPALDDEYKSFITKAYTGLFYKRFILGLWVVAEGAIYDCWDDANLYTKIPVPLGIFEKATRYIAVDYGTQNACVFLDIYDCGDVVLIHREYFYSGRDSGQQKTDSQYGDDFDRFVGDPDTVRAVIVDPSAASLIVELKNRGYRVKEAINDVRDGIGITSSLIGRRIIRVHESCENLRREVYGYVWNEKKALIGKEEPLKVNDHTMDAMRYYCMTIWTRARLLHVGRV